MWVFYVSRRGHFGQRCGALPLLSLGTSWGKPVVVGGSVEMKSVQKDDMLRLGAEIRHSGQSQPMAGHFSEVDHESIQRKQASCWGEQNLQVIHPVLGRKSLPNPPCWVGKVGCHSVTYLARFWAFGLKMVWRLLSGGGPRAHGVAHRKPLFGRPAESTWLFGTALGPGLGWMDFLWNLTRLDIWHAPWRRFAPQWAGAGWKEKQVEAWCLVQSSR